MADLTELKKEIESLYKFIDEIKLKESRFETKQTKPDYQANYWDRTTTTVVY